MPRALVVGSPIDHSLSPTLHEAGYRAAGLDDWSYARAEVVADEVRAFVARLDDDAVGLSVTMPCKEAALAVADEASALEDVTFVFAVDGGVEDDGCCGGSCSRRSSSSSAIAVSAARSCSVTTSRPRPS